MRRHRWFVVVVWIATASAVVAQTAPLEKKVSVPTRLDWAFAVHGFGKDAANLPADFDSTKHRYQIFVPKNYSKDKVWPFVLFISPSSSPMGWTAWRKVCEAEGVLFASPFGAGNNVPAGLRTRIVLDVFDDVRRHYRIDPDQTYLTGFSGGGRMACAIGFALPEYFGGIAPICGTNPLPSVTYLRHRLSDRLSVAFITGETDGNRKENEVYLAPWAEEIGIRTKLWIVPKMGHAIPSPASIDEVYRWLKVDVPRRLADVKARPKLAVNPDEGPTTAEQAKRMLEAAVADLRDPRRVWRGVALLQGVKQRFGKTETGQRASELLKKIAEDEKLLDLIGVQGAEDETKSVSAQAKALERFGQIAQAMQAWEILARNYEGTAIGKEAIEHISRLRKMQ